MSIRFTHQTWPQRVVLGTGVAAAAVEREAGLLGASRVLVIASRSAAATADSVTAGLPVVWRHPEVAMHVPAELAERARAAAADCAADALVSVGGGSATGLAKAIALTTGLPIVAVPTTYAGSEATSVWGITENGVKRTGTDPAVLPRAIVYDAAITTSLPVDLSVASGLNALAHCVDSLWAPAADPVNRAFALEGIAELRAALPAIVADPAGLDGRERALAGSYLAAAAFASAGSGLHHKICHVLGGAFNLPHAQTHAIVLPQVLAFNAAAAPEALGRVSAALGADDAVDGLERLRRTLRAPRALRDYGFTEPDIPDAARMIAAAVPAGNPRPVTEASLSALLRAAWAGQDPAALTLEGA